MNGMGCEQCREELSARLDGEDDPARRVAVDAHLAGCADCRSWAEGAAAVTRLARTGVAAPGVDLVDAVLPAAPGRTRFRLAIGLRVLLGALGAAQVFLGLVQVAALGAAGNRAHDATIGGGASPNHLWHESAAWNVAVGAAFLWVGSRRGRPAGVVPVLTAFVAMLGLLSAGDVLAGRVAGLRLASHLFLVAGYLIVLTLSRPALTFGDPPGSGLPGRSRWRARFDDETDAAEPTAPTGVDDRPAARRREAA